MISFLSGVRVLFIQTWVTAVESIIEPCCYHVESSDVLVQHFLCAYVGEIVWSLLLYLLQVTLTHCAEGFLCKQNHKEVHSEWDRRMFMYEVSRDSI